MTQDQRSGRRRRRGKRLRSLGRNGPLAPAAGPPFRQAAIMSCCLARRRPLKEALSRRAAARQTRPQFQVLQEPFQACSARWGRVKYRTAQQLFTLDAPNMGRILFYFFYFLHLRDTFVLERDVREITILIWPQIVQSHLSFGQLLNKSFLI